MVDYIIPKKDVLDLYRKQKSEFNFQQRSDDEFIVFLLDTASRVLSIAHQLTPVIEAVSYDIETEAAETLEAEAEESQENLTSKSESNPNSSQLQQSSDLLPEKPADRSCKTEPMSCEEDAIVLLAKEIESVANTLLDKQCSTGMMPTISDHSKSLCTEAENLTADNNQNIDITPVQIPCDQNFKPSVTALPYSMLDMSNVQNDTSINSNSDDLLKSISSIPGCKRSSLSSKPTEPGGDESNASKVDPKGNRHELVKSKQRRCKICHKIRRKSCSICDVGLCQLECFLYFHEDFSSYNIYVEKYKCFGKNHRARINNLPYNFNKLLSTKTDSHVPNVVSSNINSNLEQDNVVLRSIVLLPRTESSTEPDIQIPHADSSEMDLNPLNHNATEPESNLISEPSIARSDELNHDGDTRVNFDIATNSTDQNESFPQS